MIASLHRRPNTCASAPRASGMAAFAISVDGLSPSHRTSYTVTSGNAPLGTLTWSATGPIGNTTFRLEVFDGYVTRASSTTFTITVANEVLTFLHPNVTGSPIMATDASGAVLWREDYQAYGERIRKEAGSTIASGTNPAVAPAANNRAWFTGKLHDETTGLSYFGARYYDPQVGRFMGFDPVGFDEKSPLSFNRYAYANNNPLKFVDPDGRNPALAEALGLAGRAYGPAAGPAILGGGVAPACGPTCGMIPGQAQAPQLPQIMSNPIQVVTGLIMSTPISVVGWMSHIVFNERGLPPPGIRPPVDGELRIGSPSRPSEAARGGKSLWDSKGGEWRWFGEDKYHNPHWDYNPHNAKSSKWQNIEHDGKPTNKATSEPKAEE